MDVGWAMGILTNVYRRACEDLVIINAQGSADKLIWEHSSCVAMCARRLARAPAVAARGPNEAALFAASLYHEMGTVLAARTGSGDPVEHISNSPRREHLEKAAEFLELRLRDVLAREPLDRAQRIIREFYDKKSGMIEVLVLRDADTLHQHGLLSISAMIRKGGGSGQGVGQLVKNWKRAKEFRFWESLHATLHFEESRKIAARRLKTYERFMEDLDAELTGRDMDEFLPDLDDTGGVL